jgi:hypothetical protein
MSSILRKLRRNAMAGRHVVPLRPQEITRAQEKMSEVILDFAEPFLEGISDEMGWKTVLGFAILCWNIALAPEEEQEESLANVLGDLGKAAKNDPSAIDSLEAIARMLLYRKKALFPNNKRPILSYEIVEKGDEMTLLVTSSLDLPPSPTKPKSS